MNSNQQALTIGSKVIVQDDNLKVEREGVVSSLLSTMFVYNDKAQKIWYANYTDTYKVIDEEV